MQLTWLERQEFKDAALRMADPKANEKKTGADARNWLIQQASGG